MAAKAEKRSKFRMVLDFLKNLLGSEPVPPENPELMSWLGCGAAVAEIEDES